MWNYTISYEKYLSLENNQTPGFTFKYREDSILLDPRNIKLGARLISNLEKLYMSLKKLDLKISELLNGWTHKSCAIWNKSPPSPLNFDTSST
mgnify:CR=1 FL=1